MSYYKKENSFIIINIENFALNVSYSVVFVIYISFLIIKIMAIINVIVIIINLCKFDLIQLSERFGVFVIRLYLKKFMT